MSEERRKQLKLKILETTKLYESESFNYIQKHIVIPEFLEDKEQFDDIIIRYTCLVELRRFLENEPYNPFLKFYADYPPGAVPAYPEGRTIWEVDDETVEIIEERPKDLVMEIIFFLESIITDNVWSALQPQVINNRYISIIDRCIHSKKKEKKNDR